MPLRRIAMTLAVALAIAAIPAGVAIGAVLAGSVARPPAGALAVFARAQTSDDRIVAQAVALPDANVTTVRRVGEGHGWTAFVFRIGPGGRGDICLDVTLVGGNSVACSSPQAFAIDGLRIAAASRRIDGTLATGDWRWGPKSTVVRYTRLRG